MFYLNLDNLQAYSLGATMLGSGGGGNTNILFDLIKYLMHTHGRVKVIKINELNHDDLVVPLAFVGAPLIGIEKIPNTRIFEDIYQKIKADYPNRNIILMPAEIGGCNALTPLLLALKHNLPILDADLIGRAFPTLDLCKPAIHNKSCNPTYLADFMGNSVTLSLTNLNLLEKTVRDITIHFGSNAGVATFIFNGHEANEYVIANSISRALELGKNTNNPETKLIGHGIVSDVFHEMRGGFLFGNVVIKNLNSIFKIYYQNEYLKVTQDDVIIESSPNIIILLEKNTQIPLTTESLTYGLAVEILSLTAPDFWLTPKIFKMAAPN